jgi:hypothetical protein
MFLIILVHTSLLGYLTTTFQLHYTDVTREQDILMKGEREEIWINAVLQNH